MRRRSHSRPSPRSSRLALAYLLWLGVIWLASVVGERSLPTLLLTYAPPVLWLLPAPFVWLWTLLTRKKKGFILVATLLAAFGAELLHWNPQQEGKLRVLTYNILGGRTTTPAALAEFLIDTRADLILLQETSYTRPEFRAPFERAMKYAGYSVSNAAEVSTFSRLPSQTVNTFSLPHNTRQVLLTSVELQGKTLSVVNVHLGTVMISPLIKGDFAATNRSRRARNQQVDVLRSIVLSAGGMKLLGGDLNTPPRGVIYRRLQAMYGPDAHATAGRGWGWTYPSLALRIDHQMTRDLKAVRAEVLEGVGSDHKPLLVEYDLPNSK